MGIGAVIAWQTFGPWRLQIHLEELMTLLSTKNFSTKSEIRLLLCDHLTFPNFLSSFSPSLLMDSLSFSLNPLPFYGDKELQPHLVFITPIETNFHILLSHLPRRSSIPRLQHDLVPLTIYRSTVFLRYTNTPTRTRLSFCQLNDECYETVSYTHLTLPTIA